MRWWLADDGANYCRTACDQHPYSPTRCDECTKPEVWPENVDAIRWFVAVNGAHPEQGRFVKNALGHISGFDFTQAMAIAPALNIADMQDAFERLQIMNDAVAAMFSKGVS